MATARIKGLENTDNTVILTDRFRRSGAGTALVADQLEPGTQLGHFLILEHLGTGGMGSTYKVHDKHLDRVVALKIIADRPSYKETLHRYHAEAQAQARVISPFVTILYSLTQTAAGPALVMEYLQGRTLAEELRYRGPLSLDEAHDIFQQALAGIADMHQAGVIHRDLKPSNIFLTQDGQVKITDFGIAAANTLDRLPSNQPLMGTLLYIPPEQINGCTVDERSDIYTLGVTLYESITGRLPFERRRNYELLHAHVQEKPRPPRNHRRLPRALEKVILTAIRKKPADRYYSAAEFAHALASALNRRRSGDTLTGRHAPMTPFSTRARPRRWLHLGYDAGLIITILAIMLSFGMYPIQSFNNDQQVKKESVIKKPDRYASLRKAWGK
jgi:serine/threonine-protein kinase